MHPIRIGRVNRNPGSPQIEAFMEALEQLVREYPGQNHPKTIRILRSYADLGSKDPMREVAIAQSKVPREMVLAVEALIFG